jgi:hypothetical protein
MSAGSFPRNGSDSLYAGQEVDSDTEVLRSTLPGYLNEAGLNRTDLNGFSPVSDDQAQDRATKLYEQDARRATLQNRAPYEILREAAGSSR